MSSTRTILGMSNALVALIFLGGCGSSGSAADQPSTSSSDALTQSIPRQDWFAIDLAASGSSSGAAAQVATKSVKVLTTPAGPAPACDSATPAQFAALSHKISSDANDVVSGLTSLVGNITSQPPTARTPDHAVWGPLTDPDSPSVYRFDVQRASDTVFAFQLAGRPKDGDESTWRPVLQGTVAPLDDSHRAGDAHVDFSVAHALDPRNGPTSGALALHFEAADDARSIELTFAGVTGPGAPRPNDAVYKYVQPNGAAATFEFVTHSDFDSDGTDELLHVQSRWDAAMGGQATVTVTSGSMAKQVSATECWNAANGAVFYTDDASVHPPAGSPDCCPK